MAGPAAQRYTVEEYLALERASETKHEFLNGRIYAMAGCSRQHDRIVVNVSGELRSRLRDTRCRPHSSDLRVKVQSGGLYTYPDVSVSCGEARFEDSDLDTLANPAAVFEVLSPSTEQYDRGLKFQLYQQLESIADIVFVAQTGVFVEHFRRGHEGHWDYKSYRSPDEQLDLANLSCVLPVGEIYRDVDFPAEPPLREA